MRALNLVGSEVSLSTSTGSTLNFALVVRLISQLSGNASTQAVVIRQDRQGNTIGSCTVNSNEATYLFKDASDMLLSSGSSTVYAAPITFMY